MHVYIRLNNSNCQGKLKLFRVIGVSSYRVFEENAKKDLRGSTITKTKVFKIHFFDHIIEFWLPRQEDRLVFLPFNYLL